jgi:hypothetical protein
MSAIHPLTEKLTGGHMRVLRDKRASIISIFLLLGAPIFAAAQNAKSVVSTANGNGTIKLGQEEFKLNAVVVKCLEDGTVEINLISEITIFLSGKWSRSADNQKVIKLEITGKATGGGIDANGEILLRDDGKSIDRLWIKGMSTTTKKNLDIKFQAQ